jgi:hypothetical protein
VRNGAITGDGPASHLFYMNEKCVNCEFQAQVRINHGGNSGMYFRTLFEKGFPHGYEAQVDNTHTDPVRTGSLYNFVKVLEQLIPDDTWWKQHIIVEGNHIQIFINDKKTVDYVDEKNTYTSGHLALQQHNAGSVVEFKDFQMKTLPGPKTSLAGTWRLKPEQSKFSVGDVPTKLEIRILEERDGIRYQSASVTPDNQKHGANYWARFDNQDYPLTGAPNSDHVAIRKLDDNTFEIRTKKGSEVIVDTRCVISRDGKTMTREGTAKREAGEPNKFMEVLEKVE